MATSGSISKTYTYNSSFTATLRWTSTTDVANNKSRVTATLSVKSNASYATTSGWNGITYNINVNGNWKGNTSTTHAISGNDTITLGTHTIDVPHNTDGTKSFPFGFSINYADVVWGSSRIGVQSSSGTGVLDQILRKSTMSFTTTRNFGEATTFNISKASSGFTHTIRYQMPGKSAVNIVSKTTASSHTWTVPTSLMTSIPSSTSVGMTIYLDTYSGTSLIGTNNYTLTANVPSSVVPTIRDASILDASGAGAMVGLSDQFIQGISAINAKFGADGAYGSSITSTTISIGAYNFSSSNTTMYLGSYSWIYGNQTVTFTVNDSRGRTASTSTSIYLRPYSGVSITSVSASRSSGGNVVYEKTVASTSIVVGSVENNPVSYKLIRVDQSTNARSDISTSIGSSGSYTIGGFDETKSYALELTVSDRFTSVVNITRVSTAKVLMDWNKDRGVGIGKMHENGALDVGGGLAYFRNGVNITNGLTLNGGLDMAGTATFSNIINANGGFNSRRIGVNSNMDWHITPGFYYCPSTADAQTMVNLPEKVAFSLFVEQHAGVKQTFTTYFNNDFKIWTRNLYDGVWGSWVRTNADYDYEAAVSFPNGNFESYSNTFNDGQYAKFYVRNYSTVTLTGAVKNKIEIGAGWQGTIATLPARFAPRHRHLVLAQGSVNNMFLLEIQTNGNIVLSRYRNSASNNYISVGSWLNIDCTYNISLT